MSQPFLAALPAWLRSDQLTADVLSAYVNCTAPDTILMGTDAAAFDRALQYAPEIGASRIVAWTGGYGPGLMKPDPRNFRPEAAARHRS